MGTNYYLIIKGRNVPEALKEETDGFGRLHIGKSSGGWHFALRVYPKAGIHDLADWISIFNIGPILNEYRDLVSVDDMIDKITQRRSISTIEKDESWYARNLAEPGLNGLCRCKVDGERCIGHGNGTWDLFVNDFS
jgi:hypothetical protein